MPVQRPERFDIKDLYLDVRLEALVDGQAYDFTGRRHFSVGFFRDNIGFGITDIHIEVNTSLQPIVEVTFKDLYGNTMFGGGYNDKGVDYSSIFRWPPPKFIMTIKGYLGRPVTWILNLKQYDVNFISDQGHYELKASFIPNQWGFFGDMPFMFLLAAKRLRMAKGQTQESAMSIFDLINIGQKVEVKKLEVTQKYDGLLNQMDSLNANISFAISDSKLIYMGQEIKGEVDGRTVKDYKSIFIKDVTSDPNSGVKSLADIKNSLNNPAESEIMKRFLFSKMRIGGVPGKYESTSLSEFSSLPQKEQEYEMNRCTEQIRNNIRLINDEANAEVYDSTKVLIGKITISQLFRQITKDAAYIMGRILEAGFKGNSNDQRAEGGGLNDRASRREAEINGLRPNIVGQYYPLTNSKEQDGTEVPATSRYAGSDYGVEDAGCEMAFVREFIQAIVEGIANDLPNDNIQNVNNDEQLVSRISNLEAVRNSNPYKPFFLSIAENVLVRSGISAFMTRSDDPNLPGAWDQIMDRDGVDSITKLAESDARNITESMLKSMSDSDVSQLSDFARFFDLLFSSDGRDLLTSDGQEADVLNDGSLIGRRTSSVDEEVHPDIMNYMVVMNYPDNTTTEEFNTQEKIASALSSGRLNDVDVWTIKKNIVNGPAFSGLRGMVDPNTLMSRRLINNSLVYTYPHNVNNGYFVVVYEGEDARSVRTRNSTATDSEFNSSDIDKNESQARGLIELDKYSDGDGIAGRVEQFNYYVRSGLAMSYSELKRIPSNYRSVQGVGDGYGDGLTMLNQTTIPEDLKNYLWKKEVVENVVNDPNTETLAGDIVYTALFHKEDSTRLVFGPFLTGNRGRNQRIYIKTMCADILKKIRQTERNKQQVVNKILGKANEHEEIIYKQFHSIFHQWSSLAYSDSISNEGAYNGSSIPAYGDGIANSLERIFAGEGDVGNHVSIGSMSSEEVQDLPDSTFIYDYPLQRIKETEGSGIEAIDVKNSIINIDPLYKPDANTTVLNMFYNLCSKNNFMFIPIPGYSGYLNVMDIYRPYVGNVDTRIRNYFHILFMPTPESRSLISSSTHVAPLTFQDSETQRSIKGDAIGVTFGATDNQIVRNVSVSTKDNKVTAESIINLQRLTDNEDQNKVVTKDCSMLNVMAGRSYTSKIDTIGNAQIYPMQFFFLERMPMFDGLYQIMKVEHSIRPNDMTTSFEGIRMRFNPGSGYFSIPPITLETLQKLSNERPQANTTSEYDLAGDSYLDNEKFERSATTDPLVVSELRNSFQNGRIPESALFESSFMVNGGYIGSNKSAIKYKLEENAARSLDRMMDAFKNSSFYGKQKVYITDGYRDYQEQVYLKEKYGDGAAAPGTSNHGWAVAVDFWWGMKTKFRKNKDLRIASFTHPNYKWFHENAHKFGWYNPVKLRDGRGVDEWWHWEYYGTQDEPEQLYAEYDLPFDFAYVPTLRSNGATFVLNDAQTA